MSYRRLNSITAKELNEITNAYAMYTAHVSNLRTALINIGFTIRQVDDGWLLVKRIDDCSTKDKNIKCRVMVRSLKVDEVFTNAVYLTVNEDKDDDHDVVSVPIVRVSDYYGGEI